MPPSGGDAAMKTGRLRVALSVLVANLALLGFAAPAFAQSFTEAAAWVSEIDFVAGRFEVEIGAADVPADTLGVCFAMGTRFACARSTANWRAGSHARDTMPKRAEPTSGSF